MYVSQGWLRTLLAVIVTVAAAIPTAPVATPEPQAVSFSAAGWVGSWAAAVTRPGPTGISATGVTNTTLRQVAHLSVGGAAVRLRFSNVYGTKPMVIGRTTVASRKDTATGTPRLDPARLVPVTFAGRSSVTIPAGGQVTSDPARLLAADDSDLVISTYFPQPTGPLTQHPAGYAIGWAATGDQTGNRGPAYKMMPGMARYLLTGIDVRSRARGSVVLFGDSITDGAFTPLDKNLRYPDQLADLLLTQPPNRTLGVLNAGISGNRLLTDSGTAGDAAITRFNRDVIQQTGVRTVVLLEGINDIRGSRGRTTPQQLIAAQRQFIRYARAAGLKVVGATLTPFGGNGYYTPSGEADRLALNRWIRTSGEFDAVVDFDKVVRNPRHPALLLPAYDCGDHLHPNEAGLKAMARAFDVTALA